MMISVVCATPLDESNPLVEPLVNEDMRKTGEGVTLTDQMAQGPPQSGLGSARHSCSTPVLLIDSDFVTCVLPVLSFSRMVDKPKQGLRQGSPSF